MRFIKTVYLNLSFYTAFLVYSSIGIPVMTLWVVLVSFVRPRREVYRQFRIAISTYGRVVTSLGWPLVKIKVENRSGIDFRKERPFIFVFNHRSSSDPFLVSTHPLGTEIVQVVNKWPFKLPVLGFMARLAKYLDVNSMSFDDFRDKAVELLNDGVGIVFFPEGTRSGGTQMGHFRSAAFKLFLETKVPIIPVCISGNEDIPHKGSLKLNPGIIKVRYLPPVYYTEHEGSNAFKVKTAVRQIIEDELKEMDARQ